SSATLGVGSATCTSKNFSATLPRSRFFHTKKYDLHKARSRQNVVTSSPLRACSETSFRHFAHAFFVRLVMPQHCYATQSFTRWGSFSAHRSKWAQLDFLAMRFQLTTPSSAACFGYHL